MGYRHVIASSIREIAARDWDQLRRGEDDVFMDRRFILAVEEAMHGESKFWHVIVHDDSGRPAASACLCLYRTDAAILGQPWIKSMADRLRRVYPRFLRLPILFCGLPVSCGQSHLRLAPDADPYRVAQELSTIARRLADRHGAMLIILKEFSEDELPDVEPFTRMGYLVAESPPMNCFDRPFRDFDHFCQTLRSHYRYKFRRSQRRFDQAQLRLRHFQGREILDRYTDEVHELYQAVWLRAENKLELLPAEFFRKLAQHLPDTVRFMAIEKDARIVAFSWGLMTPQRYQNLFVGIDYRLNAEADLYFNLMAKNLDFALKQKVAQVYIGQSANVFKSRLGCQPRPLYVLAASHRFVVRQVMRRFRSSFFPPPKRVERRRLLRDPPQAGHAGAANKKVIVAEP